MFFGYQCRIFASKATIHIGNRCNIGPNVSIETAGHWFNHQANKRNSYHKPVVIQDNVWIGAGCIILPGVTIGRNSIVAAGAVVAKDVAECVLVGGVPARTNKTLPDFAPYASFAG
ncbi:DapH/DapD/GlmU-related protein [Methylobacterium sp. Leaf123]|uniref:DapH/DapD/GlmU-related protein n=1 Tax=Methylobacterium sp. Leaf123 TaxID=1736264 RepID=UPI0009E71770|nr:DapH/DapD/GlmU-related protein [Methylobacterium sp. Leaf123]